jgi:hypothetical protein
VWGAMAAMNYWAVYVEGDKPWDKGKLGWNWKITNKITVPAFEFYIFAVMCPLFLSLPLIVSGWDTKLFGILVSAYLSGIILEDYLWFVVNPKVSIKQFNSKWADYYPWLKIGTFEIPWGYLILLAISITSWYLLWR